MAATARRVTAPAMRIAVRRLRWAARSPAAMDVPARATPPMVAVATGPMVAVVTAPMVALATAMATAEAMADVGVAATGMAVTGRRYSGGPDLPGSCRYCPHTARPTGGTRFPTITTTMSITPMTPLPADTS